MKTDQKRYDRGDIVKYEPIKKSTKDRRKNVSWAVFDYYDNKGIEYRKSFEAPINTTEDQFKEIAPLTLFLVNHT